MRVIAFKNAYFDEAMAGEIPINLIQDARGQSGSADHDDGMERMSARAQLLAFDWCQLVDHIRRAV